jgi:hypothetical protein
VEWWSASMTGRQRQIHSPKQISACRIPSGMSTADLTALDS